MADLLYYHKSGHVYCARDYASLINIPRCAACDELIFASEYTGAENRVWHLRHFCCYECDKPLAGHKYIPGDNGHPLCLMCFQAKHGKVGKPKPHPYSLNTIKLYPIYSPLLCAGLEHFEK